MLDAPFLKAVIKQDLAQRSSAQYQQNCRDIAQPTNLSVNVGDADIISSHELSVLIGPNETKY